MSPPTNAQPIAINTYQILEIMFIQKYSMCAYKVVKKGQLLQHAKRLTQQQLEVKFPHPIPQLIAIKTIDSQGGATNPRGFTNNGKCDNSRTLSRSLQQLCEHFNGLQKRTSKMLPRNTRIISHSQTNATHAPIVAQSGTLLWQSYFNQTICNSYHGFNKVQYTYRPTKNIQFSLHYSKHHSTSFEQRSQIVTQLALLRPTLYQVIHQLIKELPTYGSNPQRWSNSIGIFQLPTNYWYPQHESL